MPILLPLILPSAVRLEQVAGINGTVGIEHLEGFLFFISLFLCYLNFVFLSTAMFVFFFLSPFISSFFRSSLIAASYSLAHPLDLRSPIHAGAS
jgi:hypothetical protein